MDFAYHRSLAPTMWVFFGLAVIELLVVHLLLGLWRPRVAIIVSIVSASGLLWIAMLIRSFRRLPVRIADGRLVMRAGTLRGVSVPLDQVAGLRASWDAAAVKDRSMLNLALIAWPNVVVDLTSPLPGRRAVTAIAHRLDDPDAFAAAVERLGGGDGR